MMRRPVRILVLLLTVAITAGVVWRASTSRSRPCMSLSRSPFAFRSERVISLKEAPRRPSSPLHVTGISSSSWSRATRRVAWTSAATGRIRWWLIEAGGGVKTGEQTTQTLVLTLTPGLYGEDSDGPQPLDVGDEERQPGG